MVKVLMAAPFDSKGRYKGGIHAIVNSVLEQQSCLQSAGIEIVPFNTCRIERTGDANGKMNLSNLENFRRLYFSVKKEIKKASPQVFYCHSSVGIALLKDLLVLRRAKKTTGVKTVLHIHFAQMEKILTGKASLDKLILKLMKKYTDHVVFLSKNTMEEFKTVGLEKCSVIYNFSTLRYAPEELQLEDQIPQFLFVGSIDQRKGLFDAMDVLAQIEKPYTLHVCGGFANDEDRARYEQLSEKLGDKLQFHGYVDYEKKKALYGKADALLLPSYGEGLPMVILEAFSAACSVITTDVGAIPEIVTAENGAVVPAGDIEKLREAITSYLDMEYAQRKEQKLRNYRASEQFTIEKFIEHLAAVCREV